jgi:hypothetical protein
MMRQRVCEGILDWKQQRLHLTSSSSSKRRETGASLSVEGVKHCLMCLSQRASEGILHLRHQRLRQQQQLRNSV